MDAISLDPRKVLRHRAEALARMIRTRDKHPCLDPSLPHVGLFTGGRGAKVFLSYSESDSVLYQLLSKHLRLVEGCEVLETWSFDHIVPGDEYEAVVQSKLIEADIVVLLLSADYVASDRCFEIELRTAFRREAAGRCVALPVLLRPFAGLDLLGVNEDRVLPPGGKPVSAWPSQDEAWTEIVEHLRLVAERISSHKIRMALRQESSDEHPAIVDSVVRARPAQISPEPFPVAAYLPHHSRIIRKYAQFNEPLLISGATGTGKTQLAKWVHLNSRRSHGPFVACHLQGLQEGLARGMLFGWRKGAYTGADSGKKGLVRSAEGGTLLIDDVDTLSLDTQALLLHFVETGCFRPLGDTDADEQISDVRIVAATGIVAPMPNTFRTLRIDLFHRLSAMHVSLPSLEQCRESIAGWAAFMLARVHDESECRGEAMFSEDAIHAISHADWPGNLRELNNSVRAAYYYALPNGGLSDNQALVITARHFLDTMLLQKHETPVERTASVKKTRTRRSR